MLCDMLRNYASSTQDDWDTYVACAEFAVNNSYHESIQTTPFYLNYSQHPDTPFTVGVRQHVGRVAPHAVVYTQKLQDAVKAAKESLRAAQDRQRAYANQGRLDFTLQPDEMVLLNTKNIKFKRVGNVGSKKLMPKWIGPFKVVNMVGNAAVKLELPGSYRIHNVFHVSLVKKYKKPPADIDMTPAEVLSEETNWVVHKVLTHKNRKTRKGQYYTEYLVQWKNKGPEHNTWVHEDELSQSCAGELSLYWSATTDDRPQPKPTLMPNGVPTLTKEQKSAVITQNILGMDDFDDDPVLATIHASHKRLRDMHYASRQLRTVVSLSMINGHATIGVK